MVAEPRVVLGNVPVSYICADLEFGDLDWSARGERVNFDLIGQDLDFGLPGLVA
jgi:hypothetical protein